MGESKVREEVFLDEKNSPIMPQVEKKSCRMLSGDFGVRVVCVSEHHFFLDITFY
jgi:hypothetical protein